MTICKTLFVSLLATVVLCGASSDPVGDPIIDDLLASVAEAARDRGPTGTITADLDSASAMRSGATYYVDPDGDDSDDGSEATPFKTLDACVKKHCTRSDHSSAGRGSACMDDPAIGGDTTCVLRSGRYQEEVNIFGNYKMFKKGGSLVITGHKDDKTPPIIDGTVAMDGLTWTKNAAGTGASGTCKYRSSKWSGEVKPYQLWFSKDGAHTPFTPARFPNAKLSDFSAWDLSVKGSAEGPMCYSSDDSDLPCKGGTDQDTPPGEDEELTMVFSGENSDHDEELLQAGSTHGPLAGRDGKRIRESNIDFTDTMVVMNFGAMGTQTTGCRVKSYNATGGYLKYTVGKGFAFNPSTARGHNGLPFFFEGHPKLLDSEEEWSFDSETGEYLVQTWEDKNGECVDPATLDIRGKVRDVSISVELTRVLFKGVTFFGTTFMNWRSPLTFDHVTMDTPTFNKRTVGEGIEISATKLNNVKAPMKMVNSKVLYHDSPSLFSEIGDDFVFQNNFVKGSCYAGCSSATITTRNTPRRTVFTHNTVTHFNAISGVSPSVGSTIEYNLISNGATEYDAACIHVQATYAEGTVVRYNWVLDSLIKSIRTDRINKDDAPLGYGTTIENNVVYNAAPMFVKGDRMKVNRNSVMNSPWASEKSGSLAVMVVGYSPPLGTCGSTRKGGWGKSTENSESEMSHNVADSYISVFPTCDVPYSEVPGGGAEHNLALGGCGGVALKSLPKWCEKKPDNCPGPCNGGKRCQQVESWKTTPCEGMDNKWWETEFRNVAEFDFRPKADSESAKAGAGAYPADMTDAEYAEMKPGASNYGA